MPITALRSTAVAALAALVLAASTTSAAPVPETSDDSLASRHHLAERYFVVTHFDEQIGQVEVIMTKPLIASIYAKAPNLTPFEKDAIADAANGAMGDLVQQMKIGMIDDLARVFSAEELEAAIAFSESATGRKMLAYGSSRIQTLSELGRKLAPAVEKDFMARVCAKISCDKLHSTAPSSS